MLRLQLVSDLHIEYNNDSVDVDPVEYITPSADVLVLAGDIGSLYKIEQLSNFVSRAAALFKHTIYVFGNHEARFISLYASDLDYLLNKESIDTWICGHVHTNFDMVADGGTRLIGNQRGKPKDNICDYKKNLVLDYEY
jgi:predicted phosphodiesterase